jgi:hypothetical protein
MPLSGTGERATPVLDFPSRDGLSGHAIRFDHDPPGPLHSVSRHAGAGASPPGDGDSTTVSDRV